jgi:hypothetical protein
VSEAMPVYVELVNRTSEPIDAMFNGRPLVLKPGYELRPGAAGEEPILFPLGRDGKPATNMIEYFAAEMAKRQNPIMGTEDPESPATFESLLGVEAWGDDISYVEQSDKTERIDRSLLDDEAQKAISIRNRVGRRKRGGRKYTDMRLRNPAGIRADLPD